MQLTALVSNSTSLYWSIQSKWLTKGEGGTIGEGKQKQIKGREREMDCIRWGDQRRTGGWMWNGPLGVWEEGKSRCFRVEWGEERKTTHWSHVWIIVCRPCGSLMCICYCLCGKVGQNYHFGWKISCLGCSGLSICSQSALNKNRNNPINATQSEPFTCVRHHTSAFKSQTFQADLNPAFVFLCHAAKPLRSSNVMVNSTPLIFLWTTTLLHLNIFSPFALTCGNQLTETKVW